MVLDILLLVIYFVSLSYKDKTFDQRIKEIREYFELIFLFQYIYKLKREIYKSIVFDNNKLICISKDLFTLFDIESKKYIFKKKIELDEYTKIKLFEKNVIIKYKIGKNLFRDQIKLYKLIEKNDKNNGYSLNEIGEINIKEMHNIGLKLINIMIKGNNIFCFFNQSLCVYELVENKNIQLKTFIKFETLIYKAIINYNNIILFNSFDSPYYYKILKLKNYQIEYSDVLPNEAISHCLMKMKIYKNKIFSLSDDSFYIFSISEKKIIEEINYNRSFRNLKITENGNIFAYRSNNIYKLDLKTKKAYKIIGVNARIESLNIMEKDKNLFFIVNNKYIYYYSENIRYKYFFVNILQNLLVLLYTLLSSILFSIFLKINLISNLIAFFVIMFLSFLFDIVPYDLGLIIIRFIYFIKLIYHNIIDIRKEILGSLAKLLVIGFIYALTFIIDLLGYTSNKIYRRQIHNRRLRI